MPVSYKNVCALFLIAVLSGCSGDKHSDGNALGDGGPLGDGDDGGSSQGNGSSGSGNGGSGSGNGGSGSGADGGGGQGGSANAGDGGTGINNFTDGGIPDALKLCGDAPCQCADGIDNDNDGVTDGFDGECQGPADNDEGSFATGISGDNRDPKWQDCFFDGNSGGGDDGCRYSTGCLTGDKSADDKDCTVTQSCIDFCIQRTPTGCDCFGCCTVRGTDGTEANVVITADCDEAHLDKCTTCVPSTQCNKECGECELCPGRTAADLPASCGMTGGSGGSGSGGQGGSGGADGSGGQGGSGGEDPPTAPPEGPPSYTCDFDFKVCQKQADCMTGDYCSLGCCTPIPPD